MELSILYGIQSIHSLLLDFFMIFISLLGNAGIMWIVIGVLMCCFKKYRRCGIMVLLSLLLGYLIGNVFLKNVVARARPCWVDGSVKMLISIPKDYSFPSGHTLSSFAAATSVYFNNKKLGIVLFVVSAVMGFSRMYLFVHYPSDVIAGMILGILIAYLVKKVFEMAERKIGC